MCERKRKWELKGRMSRGKIVEEEDEGLIREKVSVGARKEV